MIVFEIKTGETWTHAPNRADIRQWHISIHVTAAGNSNTVNFPLWIFDSFVVVVVCHLDRHPFRAWQRIDAKCRCSTDYFVIGSAVVEASAICDIKYGPLLLLWLLCEAKSSTQQNGKRLKRFLPIQNQSFARETEPTAVCERANESRLFTLMVYDCITFSMHTCWWPPEQEWLFPNSWILNIHMCFAPAEHIVVHRFHYIAHM